MKEELGINVMAFSCEGYKGVSQSAGHHIANNGVFKNIIGLNDTPDQAEFNMNILGEYNIGGDAWEIDALLRKCGIHVTSTLSGDVSYEQVKRSHTVQLNGVMCHRSINYIADMMEKKFGIPWIKVNFIGAEATKKTLRKIAKFFDSKKLTDRVEEVIMRDDRVETGAGRNPRAMPGQDRRAVCRRFEGASLSGVVSRHRHGNRFRRIRVRAPRRLRGPARAADDQGGRRQPQHRGTPCGTRSRAIQAQQDPRADGGFGSGRIQLPRLRGHDGRNEESTLIIDDISHHEIEKLIEIYKPDIIGSGIKDKFVIEKMGVPCKQLHSYDYSGPYAAFTGAANFYREVDRMVNTQDLEVHHADMGKRAATDRQPGSSLARQWRKEKWRKQVLAQTGRRRASDGPE